MRFDQPDGRVGHAELRIGHAAFFLADEFPERDFKSPQSVGGTPVTIHVFVEDVDRFFKKAVKAGAKVLWPLADQFYGDRSGQLEDPFGHRWGFATHIEDVSVKEMQARMKKLG